MSPAARVDPGQIQAALAAALAPTTITVSDDSAAHAGHAGASAGGHYTVHIEAAAFAGQTRIARHRLVYDALAPLMTQGIHALAIDAKAPGEGQAHAPAHPAEVRPPR
jgi:BolA family transcriptional regulator, general stress-responsive regulator